MLDAMELSWAIHAKRVSCREVMEAHLGHIGRMNPAANAIVSLRPREFLLAEAQERDDYLARGEMAGWMHGFPHAVKDLAATAGLRTTFGSPLFKEHVPQADAIVVERMRAAGAIIICKTNTPEWGIGSQTAGMAGPLLPDFSGRRAGDGRVKQGRPGRFPAGCWVAQRGRT
jgi:amidase